MEMLSGQSGFRETPTLADAAAVHAASTSDIDEQAALLRGWNQSYDQISCGRFQGSFLEAQIDRVQIFREITSNSLQQTGALPEGTIAIGAPVSLLGSATFCGHQCNGNQLHVFSGRDGFEFFSPRGLDIVGFIVSESDLRATLTTDEQENIWLSLRQAHLRSVDPVALNRIHHLYSDISEVLSEPSNPSYDAARLSAMFRDMVAAIVASLSGGEARKHDLAPENRALLVRNARDLVRENPHDFACVASLCRELGISRRTLQHAFQEALGVKPSSYIRAVRMNGARRAIKHANSVAEAATLWGFWHFGRFARDYHMMFGELPSEAFRRHHRNHARAE